MSWFKKRREAAMAISGSLRLKYVAYLLPERILVRTDKFFGTMNRDKAVAKYGERLLWYIQPHGYDLEICLHDEGDK